MKYANHRGFTLIELLVVIVILGVLGTYGSTKFSGYIESSKAQSLQEVVKQLNNEVLSLASLHGASPSVVRATIVKTGNTYLDVLVHGEEFVNSTYENAYKVNPHSNIQGITTVTMPDDGVPGTYQISGMPISLGTSLNKNDYIIKNVDGLVLASYISKYAKEETFVEEQSGGTSGNLAWTYNAGLYDVTISRKFN
ncbi:type II secretion system protein [Vibrio vulnificus]|uniref:type II secretion system protein n=1 Tax=Vibrio vulnificus TaxID=672 RepID=UPI0040582B39